MFVLLDLTTDTTPANMRPAQYFPEFLDALQKHTQVYFDAWSKTCPEQALFRVGTSPTDRVNGDIAINFRDSIPEAPGALAYHQVTGGIPDIEIGTDLFTSPMADSEGLLCGVSHEVLETIGDSGANGWCDRQDDNNTSDAREMCDFVQNTGWLIDGKVFVSNFVLPAFFIPGSPGPWDFLGVMTSQYDVSHGYGIQSVGVRSTTQIGGMKHARIVGAKAVFMHGELTVISEKRKRHIHARAYRRGLRI